MHLFPELLDDLRKIDRLSVAVGDDLNRPRTSGIPDLRRSAGQSNDGFPFACRCSYDRGHLF